MSHIMLRGFSPSIEMMMEIAYFSIMVPETANYAMVGTKLPPMKSAETTKEVLAKILILTIDHQKL